ncbi:hypothetical protein [Vibrio phage BONAISHI]|nr:hypothetical protein [Vibrio phage BONAISHI]
MDKPSFFARIISLVSETKIPTNLFLIDKDSYLAIRSSMFTEHGELVPMISDSTTGVKTGTLYLDDDGSISVVHQPSDTEIITVPDATVSKPVFSRGYAKEDVVVEEDKIYVKTAAGAVQEFNADDWIELETGDLITEIWYKQVDGDQEYVQIEEAVVIELNDNNLRADVSSPDVIQYINPDELIFSIDVISSPEGKLELSVPIDSPSSFSVNDNGELVFTSSQEFLPGTDMIVDEKGFLIVRVT